MPIADRFTMDRIDWNLFRTYRVIMQERSISRAAVRLHLTQSAISAALRRLEETVGHTLIHRQGGQFSPTLAGQKIYSLASDIYDHMSILESKLDEHEGEAVAGMIRILCIGHLRSAKYDEFLMNFHRMYPHATLSIELAPSDNIVAAVSQRSTTCGITFGSVPTGVLDSILLSRDPCSFFCGRNHRLFGTRSITASEIRSENLAAVVSDQVGRKFWLLEMFRNQLGLAGEVVARSENIDEVRRLVIAGYGIGCLPEHVVRDDVAEGRLWRLSVDNGEIDVGVYLIWNRKKRMNLAEKVFIDELKSHMNS
ncbi:LysR family transcriptional regulator [Burkholderia mayonis]|uniref:LysR family transcriptional regulator n=1 Tax=Burkholderia mayonis TaxID=1385591 RepID=UPI000B03E488|nr:LysR family transcriptional regulator [Burkholderia mayonis]